MAFDITLWSAKFSRENIPAFPCPRCKKGALRFDKKAYIDAEPKYSSGARDDDNWDPTWTDERFAMLLTCGVISCGQVVAVSGSTVTEEAATEKGWFYEAVLHPASMFPGPPIISTPQNTPEEVVHELELAFQLYWSDLGACATKIRTSVERLMDHFKVIRFDRVKDKKNPTKPGRLVPVQLYRRIETFITKSGKVVHKDQLHALRVVGNLGTHKNDLTRTDVLEAFQIYEHALEELIAKKSAAIAKLAKKLKAK